MTPHVETALSGVQPRMTYLERDAPTYTVDA